MAVIWPYCEISVIVMHLGYESVVCSDNHTLWLRILVLFVIAYCLWCLRSGRPTLATTNFKGRSWSIHGGCLHGLVDTATVIRWRKRHASMHTFVISGATFCC